MNWKPASLLYKGMLPANLGNLKEQFEVIVHHSSYKYNFFRAGFLGIADGRFAFKQY